MGTRAHPRGRLSHRAVRDAVTANARTARLSCLMRRHVDELVVRLPRIRVATGQIDRVDDPVGFALDLADVVRRLQTVRTGRSEPGTAPCRVPRADPSCHRERTRPDRRRGRVAVWEAALAAPADVGPPEWVHGDLEGNCLVRDGQLTGIVDWGSACVGDPAVDIESRRQYVPAGTWLCHRSDVNASPRGRCRVRGP
jgi:hypothetical protein